MIFSLKHLFAFRSVTLIAILGATLPAVVLDYTFRANRDVSSATSTHLDWTATTVARHLQTPMLQAQSDADVMMSWVQQQAAAIDISNSRSSTITNLLAPFQDFGLSFAGAAPNSSRQSLSLQMYYPSNAAAPTSNALFAAGAFSATDFHLTTPIAAVTDAWTSQTLQSTDAGATYQTTAGPTAGSSPTSASDVTNALSAKTWGESSLGSRPVELWFQYSAFSAKVLSGVPVIASASVSLDTALQGATKAIKDTSVAFVLDTLSDTVAGVASAVDSARLASCLNAATVSTYTSCLQSTRATYPLEAVRSAQLATLSQMFKGGLTGMWKSTITVSGSDADVRATRVFSSLAAAPNARAYDFVVVVVSLVEADSSSTAVSLPVVIVAWVFVIAVLLFWGLAGKKYIINDLNSLKMEMENVMLLDFSGIDEGEQRLQAQIFTELHEFRDGFLNLSDTMQQMTKYIPIEVVRDMLEAGGYDRGYMVSRVITVIFCEIQGFTAFAENINAEDLVDLAERYFDMTTKTLVSHGCTIDKYIGDCVMGIWGAPLDYTRQGFSAISAALHIIANCKKLRSAFQAVGADLNLHIGINRGRCAVGNIGSTERIAYTALGDAVNLAARLQGLNKHYNTNLIVSESVVEDILPEARLLFAMRRVGLVRVKGKEKPTAIFNPLGIRSEIFGRIQPRLQKATAKKKQTKRIRGTESLTSKRTYQTGSSQKPPVPPTEAVVKVAALSEEEEVMALRKFCMYGEDAYTVLEQLTKAVEFFEDMRFPEAVAILEDVLTKKVRQLDEMGLHVGTLQLQKDYWSLLVQHTPPRDAFDPCENMRTK